MNELDERVLERVQASGLNDYVQRSALGIARAWVSKREPIKRSEVPGYEKRDDLATEIVAIMEASGAESKQCIAALTKTRAVINRPFRDPTMQSARRGLELLKPGDKK